MKENLDYIFEECFKEVTDLETQIKKNELKEKFTKTIGNDPTLPELHKVLRWVTLFKDAKGYARERFLELSIENDYLSRQLLTAVYVSVHTYARPTQYFSNYHLERIFEKINTPFTCSEAKDLIDKLEGSFMVYRGIREEPKNLDECGFCWSLDESIAINFATANHKISGYVVSGQVEKSSIHGYVTWRYEKEIIVTARNVHDKKYYPVV
ncbi:hypothetical protein [uncultured Pedobacter sp.]|uniref:hypothetical protein n=1 Tax=uncultured Pedobacter sp. TaxID=246139 RepID=UPI0025F60BC9|nr:hypothetical protein [uncultured Pedobacter sp.]